MRKCIVELVLLTSYVDIASCSWTLGHSK